jgi:hypothetical protein
VRRKLTPASRIRKTRLPVIGVACIAKWMNIWLRHGIRLPRSRWQRIALGWLLILGGMLGFLPVLGFWMLPLGLALLSVDLPSVRRRRRKLSVWWGRRNGRPARTK